VVVGGGIPLVGPQEELRGPSGYTPRGFTSSPGREAKEGFSGFIITKKQTKKQRIVGVSGLAFTSKQYKNHG